MATTEERLRILKMVEEGKLSADDATALLSALAANERKAAQARSGPSSAGSGTSGQARYLRIRVTDLRTNRPKVNLRVPLGIFQMLVRAGTRFDLKANVEGLNMASILEAVNQSTVGPLIDVIDTQDQERVEIAIE
jgi:hypothetical protein